jgi:hypothetical protein
MEGVMSRESEDAPVPTVLPSSTELFYFYGQTLEQCGKYTTGEPMRRLAKVFAKWLKIYSGVSAESEEREVSPEFPKVLTLLPDEVLLAGLKKCVRNSACVGRWIPC